MAGIGIVLHSLREAAGLTQEELAERSGLSARTVSDVERGLRRRLYADTAERLARALGLTGPDLDDFLERARGKDTSSPALDAGFRSRFVAWHVARVDQVAQDVGNEERWYAVLDADEANVTVALQWAEEARDAESLLRLATGLWQYWQARSSFATGRRWLRAGLGLSPPASLPLRSKAQWGLAWLAYQQGDHPAAAEAAERLSELAEEAADSVALRNAATVRGMVALAEEDVVAARRQLGDALEVARGLQHPWLLATSLLNLGIASIAAGETDGAQALVDDALQRYRSIGDERFQARSVGYLGLVALVQDRDVDARELFAESLSVFARLAEPSGTAEGLTGLAAVAAAQDDPERAATLAGAAERLRESFGGAPLPVERRLTEARLDAARKRVGAEAWTTAWTAGRALRLDAAIDLALAPRTTP